VRVPLLDVWTSTTALDDEDDLNILRRPIVASSSIFYLGSVCRFGICCAESQDMNGEVSAVRRTRCFEKVLSPTRCFQGCVTSSFGPLPRPLGVGNDRII
jgi:hypothetical protein